MGLIADAQLGAQLGVHGGAAQQCFDMGANWQKGANFGKPTSTDALQIPDRSLAPRTYRFSVGLRF